MICILAADCPLFPKRYLKASKYGMGLMDIGIGLFVCVSSAQNQIYSRRGPSVYVLIFGLLRLLILPLVNYSVAIEEYGRHWNASFTLYFSHLFAFLEAKKLSLLNATILSAIRHVLILHFISKYSNYAPTIIRDNWPGIISITGFVFLNHCCSLITKYVLECKHEFTYKAVVCISVVIMFLRFVIRSEIDRGFCNITYCAHIIFIALFYFMVTQWQFKSISTDNLYIIIPRKMMLILFAISNITTGLLNLFFQISNRVNTVLDTIVFLGTYCGFNLIITHLICFILKRI
ncbi:hypothetical protein GJ496_011724 [Pomphorhynchus laevis]|nr:hypothetical protein GJ496_011724 [Pomphorhynchus laevis]